jgi:hypothetical protein
MSTFLFSHRIAYKVGNGHTPFQPIHRLHPLLPTKYMLPSRLSDDKDPQLVKVLISRLFELEKYKKTS